MEVQTREEVMREMEARMRSMELMFAKRLMSEVHIQIFLRSPCLKHVPGRAKRNEDRCKNRFATSIWAVQQSEQSRP